MVETKIAKPFLRWAGGKRWLKNEIDELVNINNYESYHEPFVGGGAILFHLKPNNAFISDANKELIDTYLAIKENPHRVIENLKKFQRDKESYYIIRAENFKSNCKNSLTSIILS